MKCFATFGVVLIGTLLMTILWFLPFNFFYTSEKIYQECIKLHSTLLEANEEINKCDSLNYYSLENAKDLSFHLFVLLMSTVAIGYPFYFVIRDVINSDIS